jgi:transposase-like protein
LDKVFVKINGETYSLWRAVDHEGAVFEFLRRNGGIERQRSRF